MYIRLTCKCVCVYITIECFLFEFGVFLIVHMGFYAYKYIDFIYSVYIELNLQVHRRHNISCFFAFCIAHTRAFVDFF